MTKKYNIQLSDLESLLDMLSAYDDNEIVSNDINTLRMAIARFKNNFAVKDESTLLEKICLNLSVWEEYTKLYNYVDTFANNGPKPNNNYSPEFNSILLSDDDTLDLCRDFFVAQGPFFSKSFDEFREDAEDHLLFFKPNDNSEGEMDFIESTGDAFVFSPDYKNIKKPSILIHEAEHVIDAYNNPKFYRNRIIREVGSTFMEMIGCNHLAKILNLGDDGDKRRAQIHTIVKSNSSFVLRKIKVLHFMSGLRDQSVSQVLRKTRGKFRYTKDYIKYMFETNLVEDYYYQISYLIAIELYELYKIDKDKALYILIDIITNGNDNNIFDMLKKYNIILNNSVETYERDFCKTFGLKIKED